MKRFRRRGQSIVEMALLFPVLCLILFGIVDFSYYVFTYSSLESAVRRGAEQASKTPPEVSAATGTGSCVVRIKDAMKVGTNWFNWNDVTVTISYPTSGNTGMSIYPSSATRDIGEVIEVKVNYSMRWLTPLGPMFKTAGVKPINLTSRRSILNTDTNGDCTP